ncbi:MAG: glycoside hydrolase family 3 N-terminal domain-containing protein [Woeseiaceae bacterium]|nr:glycoside hydrolase family 3 N-terminal domain-containing protein [Woeseiaceae bacterium]
MQPYEKLVSRRAIAGVMLAHVVYAETDPTPAGFSPYWIKDQLRGHIGFDGAVFCDDLSMKAAAEYGRMPERARRGWHSSAAAPSPVTISHRARGASETGAPLREYFSAP